MIVIRYRLPKGFPIHFFRCIATKKARLLVSLTLNKIIR